MNKIIFIFVMTVLVACGKSGTGNNTRPPESTPAESTQPSNPATTKDPLKYVVLISPSGQIIKSSIASTPAQQTQGLQGVKDSQFAEDEAKLFFYLQEGARTFWMPNTYFNLDIIYLDQNLKITDIVWNLPSYSGRVNSQIPRAPTIISRHVLEMKAGSTISSRLKIGDSLQWNSPLTLFQTELKIRQQ